MCSGTAREDRRATHKRTITLPFCHRHFTALKPKPQNYPKTLETLGDFIRAKRMDLGIPQKVFAKEIGADIWTVQNWETNRTLPSIRWMPKLIDFLGYTPYVSPLELESWIDNVQRCLGVSRLRIARQMGIDPGTLSRWLRRGGHPRQDLLNRIRAALTPTEPASA